MITLDTPLRSLEIVLSTPVIQNEFPIILAFSKVANSAETFRSQISQTRGTTAVNVLQAPKGQVQLQIKQITIQNKDSANNTVTIRYNNNNVIKDIVSIFLQPLDTLFYEDGSGFMVIDSNGRTTLSAVGAIGSPPAGFGTANTPSFGTIKAPLQNNIVASVINTAITISGANSVSVATVPSTGNIIISIPQSVNVNSDVFFNTITIGNFFANSSFMQLADFYGSANLKSFQLDIGNSTVNSTGFYISGVPVSGGGGTPGGSNTQIQFNDSGTFSGNSNFTWNKATSVLTVLGNVVVGNATSTISGNSITVGISTINSTAIAEGANAIINTSTVFVGNSIVNATMNSSTFALNGVAINSGQLSSAISAGRLFLLSC